ncbi:iron-containing alcohol dehydrogenase [Paenibacillus sp. GCM10023252]|uniref:iron-containing alcohol dehydrogenase n=1 Tax=Paenibacillus sp. GCM10023252 TaxID=3252649 RepID=UPI00360648B4
MNNWSGSREWKSILQPSTFQTAGRVVYGSGTFNQLGELAASLDWRNVAIVTSPSLIRLQWIDKAIALLGEHQVKAVIIQSDITEEPSIEQLERMAEALREQPLDGIIGIGGGSVLDAAKLLSVRYSASSKRVRDMLGIGNIDSPGLPTILIPTTSGTGSEVTPNAIVTLPEEQLKIGVVSPCLYPAVALLDPMLTLTLPPAMTASTGMDAFTHAIESYISNKSNPISDTFALEAIRLIADHIVTAYQDGSHEQARAAMMLGSMYGGMALSCSGTAAVHALAYPLGGTFHIPHGVANAMLLPHVLRYNADTITSRLTHVSMAMGLSSASGGEWTADDAAAAVIERIEEWTELLGIPQNLAAFGVQQADLLQLAEAASRVTRLMNNNPKPIPVADIERLYAKLLS